MKQALTGPEKAGSPLRLPSAPLWRRLAAMVYEALLVAALVLLTGLAFQVLPHLTGLGQAEAGWRITGSARLVLQASIALSLAAYFGLSWRHGQTLAMRAWRLRIQTTKGELPTGRRALARLALASLLMLPAAMAALWLIDHGRDWLGWIGFAPIIAGLLWSRIDSDRQAAFDRLAGTRLVLLPPVSAARSATS